MGSLRLQIRSSKAFGHRCFLLPHAAGFVDPLLSNGLAMTAHMLNRFPRHLMDALADGDFSEERFSGLDTDLARHVDYYDWLVGRMYDSFQSFESRDAWFRI